MYILLLCMLSASVSCQNLNFLYLPQYTPKLVYYEAINPFSPTKELLNISQGRPVETLDEVMLQKFMEHNAACDLIQSVKSNGELVYVPAFCTAECPTRLGDHSNATCLQRDRNLGVCCPVTHIEWYREKFQNEKWYQHQEMVRPRFLKNISMMGSVINRTVFDDYDTLNDPTFKERLSQELVCGVKVNKVYRTQFSSNDPLAFDYEHSPFICVTRGNCMNSEDRRDLPLPEWHDFCTLGSALWYESAGHNTPTLDKNYCCYIGAVKENYFGKKLHSWKLPQMPFYMKYAPGLRANYMCEYYSRYVCEGPEKKDTCDRIPQKDHIANDREFPHMARLGIVAPKVMLFHCLGSIISRRFILSVWSCRSLHGIDTSIVQVGNDKSELLLYDFYREKVYYITEVINVLNEWTKYVKPYYLTIINELKAREPALYRTSQDIEFNSYIRPACIYYKQWKNRPTEGVFAGLGRNFLDEDNLPLEDLYRRVPLKIISNGHSCLTKPPYDDRLNNVYANVTTNSPVDYLTFCAGNETARTDYGPCKFDQGGSLVVNADGPYCQWQIIGVLASHRHNCSKYHLAVFQNISMLTEPIENIVWPLPFLSFSNKRPPCSSYEGSFWREPYDRHGE